jgi:hypothetical protein
MPRGRFGPFYLPTCFSFYLDMILYCSENGKNTLSCSLDHHLMMSAGTTKTPQRGAEDGKHTSTTTGSANFANCLSWHVSEQEEPACSGLDVAFPARVEQLIDRSWKLYM